MEVFKLNRPTVSYFKNALGMRASTVELQQERKIIQKAEEENWGLHGVTDRQYGERQQDPEG